MSEVRRGITIGYITDHLKQFHPKVVLSDFPNFIDRTQHDLLSHRNIGHSNDLSNFGGLPVHSHEKTLFVRPARLHELPAHFKNAHTDLLKDESIPPGLLHVFSHYEQVDGSPVFTRHSGTWLHAHTNPLLDLD